MCLETPERGEMCPSQPRGGGKSEVSTWGHTIGYKPIPREGNSGKVPSKGRFCGGNIANDFEQVGYRATGSWILREKTDGKQKGNLPHEKWKAGRP